MFITLKALHHTFAFMFYIGGYVVCYEGGISCHKCV